MLSILVTLIVIGSVIYIAFQYRKTPSTDPVSSRLGAALKASWLALSALIAAAATWIGSWLNSGGPAA